MASDVADLAKNLSVSSADVAQGVNTGIGLSQAADKLQALKLQNQQAQQDIASKQLSGSLSMANTYLRANDTVRKQMRDQLLTRAQQNGAPINGLLDAFDADPTLGRQWLIQSQQPGFDEKIRANPFLANQIAASDDVMGVLNHTQEFLSTAKGEQATAKAVEVAGIRADANKEIQQAKGEARDAQAEAKAVKSSSDAQEKFFTSTQNALLSGRGDPEYLQAKKDIYASKKLDTLKKIIGNLDNANPTQIQLITTEVAKMASGGVPTDSELAHLSPNGYSAKLAKAAENFTNNPTKANQGALLANLTDYGAALGNDAKEVIKTRYGSILNANKRRIGDDNYQVLHDEFLKPLLGDEKPAAQAPAAPKNYSAYIKAARAGAGGNAPLSDAQIKDNLIHMYGATADQVDAQLGGK